MAEDTTLGTQKATELVSTLMKDNKLLGFIEIPQEFNLVASTVLQIAISKISEVGSKHISTAVETLALSLSGDKNTAQSVGDAAGNIFAYGLPYFRNVLDVVGTVRDHKDHYDTLVDKVAPLLKANIEAEHKGMTGNITKMFKAGYEGNAMLEHAVHLVNDSTWSKAKGDIIGAIPTMVSNYTTSVRNEIDVLQTSVPLSRIETDLPDMLPDTRLADLQSKLKRMQEFQIEGLSAGIASGITSKIAKPNPIEHIRDNTSLGKVLEIQEFMRLRSIGKPDNMASNTECSDIAKKIEETFNRFQAEQEKPLIPEKTLKAVSAELAKELAYGDLEALSLINIIGKGSLYRNDKKDDLDSSKIPDVIAQEVTKLSKSANVNVSEFLAQASYSIEDISNRVKSADATEKKMLAMLFPESVLEAGGMKKEEIHELNVKSGKEILSAASEVIITEMAKKDNRELSDMGLAPDAIHFIRECEHNPQHLHNALQSPPHKEAVLNVARKGFMAETSWEEKIKMQAETKVYGPHPQTLEAEFTETSENHALHSKLKHRSDELAMGEEKHTSRHQAKTLENILSGNQPRQSSARHV